MTEKILNDINYSDITTADIFTWLSSKDRLRVAYTEWLKREWFEYFIVLKFYDGHKINDDMATKQFGCFLRKLDRKYIERRLSNKGIRLDRMVFIEHGISGENTHFNLYISKPADVSDIDFRRHVIKFWKQATGWDDVKIQVNDNADDVLYYSTKEIELNLLHEDRYSLRQERLVVKHCYLSHLHNNDIEKLIYEGMQERVIYNQKQAKSAALKERVKQKLRLSSKNVCERSNGYG